MEPITFTEFEEEISFDVDDPDFANNTVPVNRNKLMTPRGVTDKDMGRFGTLRGTRVVLTQEFGVSFGASTMSLASVRPAEPPTLVCPRDSLEELCIPDTVLSIEELRLQLNSCFTCGVSWMHEHVSLDCRECGGYSLARPCPRCDGRCSATWKRDLTMSHASGKARWEGECAMRRPESRPIKTLSSEEEARLCGRLEKLSASS